MSSLFGGLKTAKPNANSNYLGRGTYWIQIVACKIKNDRKQKPMFIMEARVVKKFGEGQHSVGEEVCHLVKQDSDYFLSDIKSIIMAATGLAEDQVGEELAEQAVSAEQPLAGIILDYQGTEKEGKESTVENPKTYVARFYKGMVPFSKLNETLTTEEKVRFFGEAFDWAAAVAAE